MILFLDFDGVLHPFFPRQDLPDEENQICAYLPRLESLLRDFTTVQIVIASDWRHRMTLDDLRQYFAADMRSRVIGVTPSLPLGDDWIGCRQREALAWLAGHDQSDMPWVALDDVSDNWLLDAPLIICEDGFRDIEEAALRRVLTNRRKDG